MNQTLRRNWFFLALCGVLDAIISIVYLIMQNTHGPLTFGAWSGTVVFLGEIILAAGACSIAAGIWRSTEGECWPLVLNGLALGALGVIYCFLVRSPSRISIRTIAFLIILTTISIGILELVNARILRRQHQFVGGWLPCLAGAALVGCALAFFALAFGWIKQGAGSHLDLLLPGSYFGFTAICMLGLALRPGQPGRFRTRAEGSHSTI